MDAQERVLFLLRKHGCQLVRNSKHLVYKLPDGTHFTMSKTPADHRAADNNLAELRRSLGISKRGKKAKPTTPSAKPAAPKKPRKRKTTTVTKAVFAETPVRVLRFREKLNRAIHSEPVPIQEPEPVQVIPTPKPVPSQPPPPKKLLVRRMRTDSSCYVYSPEEIEAANLAMRTGQLTNFLQNHTEALTSVKNQHTGVEETMIDKDSIDREIAVYKQGITAAQKEALEQNELVTSLEAQILVAKQNGQIALDKAKMLTEAVDALEMTSDFIAKARPVLGLLTRKPVNGSANELDKAHDNGPRRPNTPYAIVTKVMKRVLAESGKPMTVSEVHHLMVKDHELTNYPRTSMYPFLAQIRSQKVKADGDIYMMQDGRYGLFGQTYNSHDPSSFSAALPVAVGG